MWNGILATLSGVASPGTAATWRARGAISSNGAGGRRATPYAPVSRRRYPYALDEPLLWFGQTPWTMDMACQGLACLGDMGSGKTSSGATIAKAMLRAGFGFLVLCKKKDECDTWIKYARQTGRTKSLLIIHPSNPWRFNILDYQFTRAGEGAGNTENAVSMFMHLLSNRREASGKTAQEQRFFTDNARRLLRYLMEALLVAGERVTIPNLQKALKSLPQAHPDTGQPVWRQPSYLAECLGKAIRAQQQGRPLPYPADPEELTLYYESEFARGGSDRQSSGILSTLTGMLDPLTGPHMVQLFGTETNFLPGEFAREGAIVIVNLPLDEWEEIGRTAALCIKYIVQKCLLRRQGLPPGEVPVGIWVDEASQYSTDADRSFQEAARSSWACTIYLSQNINNYIAAMGGGPEGEANAYGLLAGLGTKLFFRNGDFKTNEFAANSISKASILRRTGGSSTSRNDARSTSDTEGRNRMPQHDSRGQGWNDTENRSAGTSESQGFHEEMDFQVQTETFTRLKSGGRKHRRQVTAIAFRSGEAFASTGRPFTGLTFIQE